MNDRDERIVSEFVAGAEVPDIAARYAVPEAYVDRVIEETNLTRPKRFDGSLKNRGNRILLSAGVALAAGLALRTPLLYMPQPSAGIFCVLVGVTFYAVMGAVVSRR